MVVEGAARVWGVEPVFPSVFDLVEAQTILASLYKGLYFCNSSVTISLSCYNP